MIFSSHALSPSPDKGIQCWGDSLTAGTAGGIDPAHNYPAQLTGLNGRPIYNGGVGGDTAVQIAARQTVYIPTNTQINILWAGRNGVLTSDPLLVPVGQMVAHVGDARFLILSIINKTDGTENVGSANNNLIVAANASLQAAYPSNYVSVIAALDDNTLRVDGLHLTAAGYAIVAAAVNAAINANGW